MRSTSKKAQFEDVLGERTSTVTSDEPRDFQALLLQCNITCGSGLEHDAEVCLVCPRFVSCVPALDGRSVKIECWWHQPATRSLEPAIGLPRRMARGSGLMEVPVLDERCAACRTEDDVFAYPGMDSVYFCRTCTEQISDPIDWEELGTGD